MRKGIKLKALKLKTHVGPSGFDVKTYAGTFFSGRGIPFPRARLLFRPRGLHRPPWRRFLSAASSSSFFAHLRTVFMSMFLASAIDAGKRPALAIAFTSAISWSL
jgi:hypothetical protein